MVLLSAVVGLARGVAKKPSVEGSFRAFDKALQSGRVPTSGKVTDRVVRAAYSALERSYPGFSIERVPNPLPKPHNLTWYFGHGNVEDEIRAFATGINRKFVRVWSVAKVQDGFRVLAQVFGATGGPDAAKMVEIETRMPAKRMRRYIVTGVSSFTMKPANVESFMHEVARGLLERQGLGDFVEVSLDRIG
jgi:hypothetical protein